MKKTEIQKYIDEWKKIYDYFIKHQIDSDSIDIDIQHFEKNREEYEHFLRLLISIYSNHSHEKNLFEKIEQIIVQLKESIKQTFSKSDLFHIFKSSKLLILFLLENQILTLDEDIYREILNTYESEETRYYYYFYPEIKLFIDANKTKELFEELLKEDSQILDHFQEKRKERQNDSHICSLIRQDLIDKFVIYTNQTNFELSSEIKPSIYETNSFLIENQPTTLIEYAAFFGSIQIFQYLKLNNVELSSSLWLYGIHSNDADIIHLLEECQVDPPNNSYEKCFIEAIKCHHNDIANYIKNNYLSQRDNLLSDDEIISTIFCVFKIIHSFLLI